MDKRWYKLADILVNYSTKVKKGDKVAIAMYESHTEDLVTALVEKVVQAGGFPQIQFLSEKIRHKLLSFGSKEQLTRVPDLEIFSIEWCDVYFGIRGGFNLGETYDIEDEKRTMNQIVNGKISKARWDKTRWCLIRVPNSDMASKANLSYESLQDSFFNSCFLDFNSKMKEWNTYKNILEKGDKVRIVTNDTDLSFSVKNRKWVIFNGIMNLPDGEIATAPITETINGYIKFKNPAVLGGQLFNDVRLEWENGKLKEYYSSNNQELLGQILYSDSGASLIGEFAFGLNYGLKDFCYDILLDEKIGGTVHIALGRAYKECGGINDSSIHWDIILDTRNNATVYLDDIEIFKNGKFLLG